MRLTASIGVATLPDVAGTAEELLRAADKAMYRVKASGKDGIQAAPESPERSPPRAWIEGVSEVATWLVSVAVFE